MPTHLRPRRITALSLAPIAASLALAAPASAAPHSNASFVGEVSHALAQSQNRDDAAHSINDVREAARKAGSIPVDYSLGDLFIESGQCPPSVCQAP